MQQDRGRLRATLLRALPLWQHNTHPCLKTSRTCLFSIPSVWPKKLEHRTTPDRQTDRATSLARTSMCSGLEPAGCSHRFIRMDSTEHALLEGLEEGTRETREMRVWTSAGGRGRQKGEIKGSWIKGSWIRRGRQKGESDSTRPPIPGHA